MNLLEKFKIGLNKSSSSLSEGINSIFKKKKVDQEILREFEDLLISSDVGIETAQSLKNDFYHRFQAIFGLTVLKNKGILVNLLGHFILREKNYAKGNFQ